MTENEMSAGDFVRLCETWAGRAFYYDAAEQTRGTVSDLRVRFTDAQATLCPNRVIFRNEYGDSLIVKKVRSVRVDRNILAGIDRITLISDDSPDTPCIILSAKITKTH